MPRTRSVFTVSISIAPIPQKPDTDVLCVLPYYCSFQGIACRRVEFQSDAVRRYDRGGSQLAYKCTSDYKCRRHTDYWQDPVSGSSFSSWGLVFRRWVVKCICHWHHFETKCHLDVVFFVQCLIVVHRLPPGAFLPLRHASFVPVTRIYWSMFRVIWCPFAFGSLSTGQDGVTSGHGPISVSQKPMWASLAAPSQCR